MDDEAARLEFLARAEELTDALYADLRLLRTAAAGRERRALLDRAFRHAHTLKGSAAASAPAGDIVRLAHGLEDVLDAARAGRIDPDAATLDACEAAADSLARALDDLARGRVPAETGAGEAAERLRARLREAESRFNLNSENVSDDAAARVLKSLPVEITAQLNDAERRRLAAAVAGGARVVSVRVAFDLERLDEDFRRLGDALEVLGEIVSTLPGEPGAADATARVALRLVCATGEPLESLSHRLAEFGAEVELLFDGGGFEVASSTAAGSGNESGVGADGTAVETDGGAHVSASPPGFVRVPLSELDELAFAASELFDDTSAALEAARAGAGEAAAEFEGRAAQLRQNFLALEERVLALRMQPLAPALARAARAGRAAARDAGKGVEIETGGGHARVDRVVAERIIEPLIHLLRNAVDHGIEPAEERRAKGKSERGRVVLRSAAEGAGVLVTVEDDGRGIELARVERAARAAGLAAEGARVTEEQALRLIFRPGFSTAVGVTETSGRGVGLDAVERAVERAGGEVRVRTRAGRGTTFELRLPLALSLLPVVLVESGGETYAIDAARVVEAGRLERSAITSEGATPRAAWRGREVRFVWLDALLGRATGGGGGRADGDRLSVVVLNLGDAGARVRIGEQNGRGADAAAFDDAAGEQAAAPDEKSAAESGERTEGATLVVVAVDGISGRRDALVRGLGRHTTRWRGVGGAIDLRDGGVALLLDLASLVEMADGER